MKAISFIILSVALLIFLIYNLAMIISNSSKESMKNEEKPLAGGNSEGVLLKPSSPTLKTASIPDKEVVSDDSSSTTFSSDVSETIPSKHISNNTSETILTKYVATSSKSPSTRRYTYKTNINSDDPLVKPLMKFLPKS